MTRDRRPAYHPMRLRLLNAVAARRVTWTCDTTSHTAGWSAGTYTTDGATQSGRRGFLRDPHQIRQLDMLRAADLVRRPSRRAAGRLGEFPSCLLLSPAGAALRLRWLADHPEVVESVIPTPYWIERHRKEVKVPRR